MYSFLSSEECLNFKTWNLLLACFILFSTFVSFGDLLLFSKARFCSDFLCILEVTANKFQY